MKRKFSRKHYTDLYFISLLFFIYSFYWYPIQEGVHKEDAGSINFKRPFPSLTEGEIEEEKGWRHRCLCMRVLEVLRLESLEKNGGRERVKVMRTNV